MHFTAPRIYSVHSFNTSGLCPLRTPVKYFWLVLTCIIFTALNICNFPVVVDMGLIIKIVILVLLFVLIGTV